jgi:hypothetical protein
LIVASATPVNATLILEGLELKAVYLLLDQITPEQALVAAAKMHDHGFNVDERDVQTYARSFVLITKQIAEAINDRLCPNCGQEHDEEEEDSGNGQVM